LEAAYGLRGHGVEVHLVQQSAHLMNRQLDPEAGGILAETVRRMGMRLHLETGTEAVLGEERVTGLRFTDGTVLPCDMVVLACGIRPNAELAAECGLVVERGIVVDDRLQTSDPHIYAVGECAQHRGEVYGVVAPLWEQVQVLAGHLTGRVPHGTYAGSRVSTRLKVAGVEVTAIGTPDARPGDEVVRFSEPSRGVYKKLVIRNGRLAGAILLGDGDRAPYLIQAFDRGTPLPHERAALLFDLGGKPGAIPVAEMEDDTTVCHCNGVSKGDIRQCALLPGGLHGVMQATRAGTGCGSCKTLVKALVDHCVREGRELAAV
jgi:nitrite reductase (NADH) large subunit